MLERPGMLSPMSEIKESDFLPAVPEIPVRDINDAAEYYSKLGFRLDWGDEAGGIAGISFGQCRLFLTNPAFRTPWGNSGPVVIWLNFKSKEEVDHVHEQWMAAGAVIVSGPEDKPWKLHEFTAADPDGNVFRVFYDFAREA